MTPVSPMPPIVASKASAFSRGRAAEDLARGGQERQLLDVPSDRPVDVVVLAVDVGGEGAPDRHEARPGDDREEEAARHEEREEAGAATSPPRRSR